MLRTRGASSLPGHYVVGIIVAVLSLVVLILAVNALMDTEYERSIQHCSTFFTQAGNPLNQPGLSGGRLDQVSEKMQELLRINCHSVSYDVTDEQVEPMRNLIQECWRKSNGGSDILAPFSEGKALYLYCGSVEAQGSVPGFDEKMQQELSDKDVRDQLLNTTSAAVNLNPLLLYESGRFPSRLDAGERLHVFFTIFKPQVGCEVGVSSASECYQAIENSVLGDIAGLNAVSSQIVSYLSAAKGESYTGVLVRPAGEGEDICSSFGDGSSCESMLIRPETHIER